MISRIHRWLDRRTTETNVFEKRMVWARELLLLAATLGASLSFSDLRSWIPALVGAFAAAVQCEDRRVVASVAGRHEEAGNKIAPLPERKAKLVENAKAREPFFVWGWPLLSAILAAGYARSVTAALVVALAAGWIRSTYDTRWYPAWRASRVKWRLRKR